MKDFLNENIEHLLKSLEKKNIDFLQKLVRLNLPGIGRFISDSGKFRLKLDGDLFKVELEWEF